MSKPLSPEEFSLAYPNHALSHKFQAKAALAPKKPKYGNRKTTIDGLTFDSKKESQRYLELKLQQAAGLISALCHHPPAYELIINNKSICKYEPDFSYIKKGESILTIEDVKSEMTRKLPVYRIKKKLMDAIFNVTILET